MAITLRNPKSPTYLLPPLIVPIVLILFLYAALSAAYIPTADPFAHYSFDPYYPRGPNFYDTAKVAEFQEQLLSENPSSIAVAVRLAASKDFQVFPLGFACSRIQQSPDLVAAVDDAMQKGIVVLCYGNLGTVYLELESARSGFIANRTLTLPIKRGREGGTYKSQVTIYGDAPGLRINLPAVFHLDDAGQPQNVTVAVSLDHDGGPATKGARLQWHQVRVLWTPVGRVAPVDEWQMIIRTRM